MRKSARLLVLALAGLSLSLAAGQDKVALRFGPAEGTRLVYNLSSFVNVDGKSFLGKDLALNADSRGEIGLLTRPSPSETVRADLTSPGIDVNVRLPDRVLAQKLSTNPGEALEIVFNRTGKVESIRNPGAISAGNPFNISLPQILRDYFPVLPVGPVGRGDTWNEARRLSIPFQGLDLQVDLAIIYTLDDVLPGDDGRLALVSAFYKVNVSGSRDLGDARGVFEGEGSGSGSLQFQVDKGWFSQYRIDFESDAAFVMKKGADRLAEFPFSFSFFAEVVLLNVQAPAPVIR
jgi:hypothetical protein